jgi:uncharacterized protein
MILETDFTVAAPADRVWRELLDLEALAACLPGAELMTVDGDSTLQGSLRPQIGGSAVECIGTLRPIDVDEDGRSASCSLRVRAAQGSAFATATLRGRVAEGSGSTRVLMSVEGRLAALDIAEDRARGEAERLLNELASSLERSIAERASRPEVAPPEPARPVSAPRAPAKAPPPPAAAPRPQELGRPAQAAALAKGVPAPAAAAGVLALLLALIFGRRRRRGAWFEIRYRW